MRTFLIVALLFTGLTAQASNRFAAESGARAIVNDYNDIKQSVGVGYDVTAGPQLVCMNKIFLLWFTKYEEVLGPVQHELADSHVMEDFRYLSSKVQSDFSVLEEFIRGLVKVVDTAMNHHQMSVSPALSLQDTQRADYMARLHRCRDADFFQTVAKIAEETKVELEPQSPNSRLARFLKTIVDRR